MKRNLWEEILVHEYRVWQQEPPSEVIKPLHEASPAFPAPAWVEQYLREQVEMLSGGENTVIFDDAGIPSIMVCLPLTRACDLLEGETSDIPHPAFRLGERELPEIWVGKYLTSLCQGIPASLPMAQPQRYRRFDEAAQAARSKGRSWQLMPYQVRMVLALSSLQKGTLPGGNNEKGHDFFSKEEQGELAGDEFLVRTGSGSVRWSHNGTPGGVWDLNGNLNEWEAGLRLVNGEIQIEDMQALCYDDKPWSEHSSSWQALDTAGQPVTPGGAQTLHYEPCPGGIRLMIGPGSMDMGNCAFQDILMGEGVTSNCELKMWGLVPPNPAEKQVLGWRWVFPQGEALPLSGGAYLAVDHAGIFFTGLTKPRYTDYHLGGMRLIYIDPKHLKESDLR